MLNSPPPIPCSLGSVFPFLDSGRFCSFLPWILALEVWDLPLESCSVLLAPGSLLPLPFDQPFVGQQPVHNRLGRFPAPRRVLNTRISSGCDM